MRFAILAHAAVISLASIGLVSCNDAVPPTPQGAWAISFQATDMNPVQCMVMGHPAQVGAVTDHDHQHLIPNGMSEAGPTESSELECNVVENPAGSKKFDVYAKMTQLDKG